MENQSLGMDAPNRKEDVAWSRCQTSTRGAGREGDGYASNESVEMWLGIEMFLDQKSVCLEKVARTVKTKTRRLVGGLVRSRLDLVRGML